MVSQTAGFSSTTTRIVLWIEIQDQFPTVEIAQADFLSVFVFAQYLWGLVSDIHNCFVYNDFAKIGNYFGLSKKYCIFVAGYVVLLDEVYVDVNILGITLVGYHLYCLARMGVVALFCLVEICAYSYRCLLFPAIVPEFRT
jgi:hypothetical protein